jgi:molybdate transport system substrate-binding protein
MGHGAGSIIGLRVAWIVMSGLTVLLGQPDLAAAAEIKIFSTRAIATVLEKVGPEFERTTGHRLNVTTDIAIRMVRRIQAGEPFDVLVAAPGQIDGLIKEGKIIPETRTNLTRSGIGVQVRAGTPKPDISSVESFKRALLNAKSIAYLKEGQSGVYLAGMLERLEIDEAIKSKVTRPETDIVSELVARGEIELGMVVITQIMTTPGVELVGPLPPEIQSYITFTGGVSTASREGNAARELIGFLTGPVALPVIRAQGMEPAL